MRASVLLPTPGRRGGPPIWIGGNARRAVDLAVRIEELRGMEREAGRATPLEVVFMPEGLD